MMSRVTFLFVAFLVTVLAEDAYEKHEDFLDQCREECCKIVTRDVDKGVLEATIKECAQLHDKPPSCEQQHCISKKMGLSNEDGVLNKANQTQYVETVFEGNAEVIQAIKDNCIEGDLKSDHGNESVCELIKFMSCVDIQKLKYCPIWNNEGDCAGAKEQAAKCFE